MMCLGVHFLHHLFDLAIYPDKKGHTVDPHVLSTHEFFLEAPNAMLLRDGMIFIGQKIKIQLFF
jgi:hypothetical protein